MTSAILTGSLLTKATGRHDRFHYAGSPGAGSGCNVLVQGSPSDGKAANSGRSLATPLGPESAPSETRADHSMTTALDPEVPFPVGALDGRNAQIALKNPLGRQGG